MNLWLVHRVVIETGVQEDVMFEVRTQGEGDEVLVLLYGIPVPAESLEPIPEWFGQDYRVIIPETVGIGIGFEESHKRLVETLRGQGVESATFVGHSGGAYRALRMAIGGEIEAKKIVTIGALANLPDERQAQYDELADQFESGAMSFDDMVDVAVELWFRPEYLDENPEMRGEVKKWFDEIGTDTLVKVLRREMQGPDLHPQLSEIDCPVYVLVGDCDVGTPPEWSEEIAERIPKATLEVVESCGHFPHFERPEKAKALLEEALSK